MSTVQCILQRGGLCDEATDSITSTERWENLKKKTLLWSGLDKFGDVPATVDWDKGPIGQCVHDACRLTLCNTKKLEQANKTEKTVLTSSEMSTQLSIGIKVPSDNVSMMHVG